MVEYETIGIISIIVGLISVQIKMLDRKNDKEHKRLWNVICKLADRAGITVSDCDGKS